MIFENTWQNEIVLHEAFINENADVSIREVTLGGDPIEDFVDYHPSIGASDDELTKICDDIYQTLMGAFVAQKMEIAYWHIATSVEILISLTQRTLI